MSSGHTSPHKLSQETSLWWNEAEWETGMKLMFAPDGKHEFPFEVAFPFAMRFVTFGPGSQLAPNYHDYLEVGYTVGGSGTLQCSGRSYLIEPGDVFVLGDTEFHHIETGPHGHLRVCVLYFLPDLLYCAGENDADMDCVELFRHHDSRFKHRIAAAHRETVVVAQRMGNIYREITSRERHYRLAVKNHLRHILLTLARYYGVRPSTRRSHAERKAAVDRLRPVFSMILERYMEKLAVNDAALAVGMSVSYFSRFFRRVTGISYTEYLLRLRVD
ncbi:MAG: helix-turn-helix transcriptional regulator, partial [Spirochaetaceae bacterium]|nr:helix-turn-helix transcriptional regulator [Spirochaetaceae bacterium]